MEHRWCERRPMCNVCSRRVTTNSTSWALAHLTASSCLVCQECCHFHFSFAHTWPVATKWKWERFLFFPSLTWPLSLSLSLSLVRGRVELESADLYLPPALPTCLCLCTVTPLLYNALEVSTTLHNSATYYANIQHNFLHQIRQRHQIR